MAILHVYVMGDEVLRKKAKPVKKITKSIRKLARDMVETMREERGQGLAAPQIGESLRMIVIETAEGAPKGKSRIITAINPEILEREGEEMMEEGCLSVPGFYTEVPRATKIRITYVDEDGKRQTYDCEDLLAEVFQHEIDHLDGILFVDRATVPLANVEEIVQKTVAMRNTKRPHRGEEY